MSHTTTADPLVRFPSETVLEVLAHLDTTSIVALEGVSRPWNDFVSAQAAIVYPRSCTQRHSAYLDARDIAAPPASLQHVLADKRSYTRHWPDPTKQPKAYARHHHLVQRNFRPPKGQLPDMRERLIRHRVWRFRPDYKARFIICTSPLERIFSVCMDTHELLWEVTKSDDGRSVRSYAHLEYSDGLAAFDRLGDGVEVWRHLGHDGCTSSQDLLNHPKRGQFALVSVLPHRRRVRGFMMHERSLCVISDQGEGYVYALYPDRVEETVKVSLPVGAIGHLEHCSDVVMYSLGKAGYHFHSKVDGAHLGTIDAKDPRLGLSKSRNYFHIKHLPRVPRSITSDHVFPKSTEDDKRILAVEIEDGPLLERDKEEHEGHDWSLSADEWGAGMLYGDWMVGISLWGRIFICSDWRGVLDDPARAADTVSIIECDTGGYPQLFQLGGWLSVGCGKLICEVNGQTLLLTLPSRPGGLIKTGAEQEPAFAIASFYTLEGTGPMSMMSIQEDHLMTTYACNSMLEWDGAMGNNMEAKGIRIVDFSLPAEQSSKPPGSPEDRWIDPRDIEHFGPNVNNRWDRASCGLPSHAPRRLLNFEVLSDEEDEDEYEYEYGYDTEEDDEEGDVEETESANGGDAPSSQPE
ncbi:uncharacterized protein PFL1_04342 [Pseudozyma flocculosa PF-1]|uniref:F-box domain-containing protein n=2 Tax=Pseudozyma flocculosa TaxID=84751 RepID=A0A5C3FAZ3_9BASI|nr:uncharacterized protein PFL1_04342 [Pseudozyma flocculosa PF-1]EPQ28015.1 hypothetical protein PFL1_04342 [Pseudozyma flocculosa PF-1]SPO41592.1 uncharacterized protein PSFLO_07074 [Pseudozyma flocculosa]